MYLSRVEVDYLNRQKTKDLSHLGAYHNWVEQSFPGDSAGNPAPPSVALRLSGFETIPFIIE